VGYGVQVLNDIEGLDKVVFDLDYYVNEVNKLTKGLT
jgi:hypothetical protein